jgi:spore germination cell wall hydrolase CwlJ-like protein
MASVVDPSGVPFKSRDELTLLATLIAGEARGETEIGQIACGWVVRNRVHSGEPKWFGTWWHGVMLKPYQFSCFNKDDPNRRRLLNPYKYFGDLVWTACYRSAAQVYFDLSKDPTFGADHYHTSAVNPKWADSSKITARIGNHIFYKLS